MVDVVLRAMDRGTGWLIVGPAGIGKSRLADDLAEWAESGDRYVVRIRGTVGAGELPLGSFGMLTVTSTGRYPSLAEAQMSVLAAAGDRPLVLVIDDINLLDDASIALVHLLATEGRGTLVVTQRTGSLVPAAVDDLRQRGRIERLDLGPLDAPATRDLAAVILGHPLDAEAAEQLWRTTHGNPLFVRELLAASAETQAITLVDGQARFEHMPTAAQRLVDLVQTRLASLDEAQHAALLLVAFGEPLGPGELGDLVSDGVLVELERLRLITASADERRVVIRLGHPLYGEVIRASTPLLARRKVLASLAGALQQTGNRRRQDVVKLARLAVDGGASVAPEVLVRATAVVRLSYDMVLAERLGRAAFEAAPGFHIGRELALALYEMGDFQALLEMMPRLLAVCTTPDEEAGATLIEAEAIFWFTGDAARADRIAESAIADLHRQGADLAAEEVAAVRILLDAARRHAPNEALPAALAMLERPPGKGVIRGALSTGQALTALGRGDDAIAAIDRAIDAFAPLGTGAMSFGELVLRDVRQLALVELGQLEEAIRLSDRSRPDTLNSNAVRMSALAGGYALAVAGRAVAAIELVNDADRRMFRQGSGPFTRWSMIVLAYAQAVAGRAADAGATLAAIDALSDDPVLLYEPTAWRARCWERWAAGDPEGARARAAEGAAFCREAGDLTGEANLLHDLARLGRAREVVARLAEITSNAQGDMLPTFHQHAHGLATQNAAELVAASDRFAAMGAMPYAAEAASAAGDAYARGGDQRAANRWHNRSQELNAQCQVGAGTIAASSSVVPLTRREREVAGLASQGLANREIAERLFISVRTAETHLVRVYEKLGVHDRGELARLVNSTD